MTTPESNNYKITDHFSPARTNSEKRDDENIHLVRSPGCQHTLVSGGTNGESNIESTELFDASVGNWREGSALPSPMRFLRAATIDNQILLFGIDISF